MNVVTGQSDVNPKHFTPNEVNLMVLNCYDTVRHQLDTVISLSNSSGKSHWRLIAEIFTQCSSACAGISLSLSLPFILHGFIFCYLSEALTVWCSLNDPYQTQSIFLSRTTDVGPIVPPVYLPPPCATIFSIPVSFTSALLCRSHLHLCYPVSSYVTLSLVLQSQTFDSRQKVWLSLQLILPKNRPLRKEKTVLLTSRAIKHCFYLHIPFSLTPDTRWVFNLFLWAWISLISSHSTVQLDSCGSADSGNSGSEDWLLPGHEQRGIPLHLRKWLKALLRIDYHN